MGRLGAVRVTVRVGISINQCAIQLRFRAISICRSKIVPQVTNLVPCLPEEFPYLKTSTVRFGPIWRRECRSSSITVCRPSSFCLMIYPMNKMFEHRTRKAPWFASVIDSFGYQKLYFNVTMVRLLKGLGNYYTATKRISRTVGAPLSTSCVSRTYEG